MSTQYSSKELKIVIFPNTCTVTVCMRLASVPSVNTYLGHVTSPEIQLCL